METIAATRLVTSGPGPLPVILPAGGGFPRRKEGLGSRRRFSDCGLRIGDCGLEEAGRDGVRAKRSQFGRLNRAKRTQFFDFGLRIAGCGFRDAGYGRAPEAKCAKQTQFRPVTEDVGRAWRRAALHAGAIPDQVGGRPYEEAKCAKRTQFSDCGLRIGDCGFRDAGWGGRPRPNVQNEAKLGQDKVYGKRLTQKSIVRNKANSPIADCGFRIADSETPAACRLRPDADRLCRTKPISARATRGASALWEKGYNELGPSGPSEKQSQLVRGNRG
jgi:hypothetical protein